MAGSEVKDLEPIAAGHPERRPASSWSCRYSGTLEGAEAIAGGDPSDAAWFSSGNYLSLLPGRRQAGSWPSRRSCSARSSSGVKKTVADKFGWTDNPNVTWKDIEAKSADGSFQFAMTNPAASNSGLVGAHRRRVGAVAAARTRSTPATIDKDALRAFFKGQALTAGSSGLPRRHVRPRAGRASTAIVNYESILMSLNARRHSCTSR